jgi:hypothetical protein
MTDFNKVFKKDKKLTEKSIESYVKNMNAIQKKIDLKIDLRNFNKILNRIEEVYSNVNTKQSYLSTLMKYIELKKDKDYKHYKTIKKRVDELNKIKFTTTKKLTEEEKENNWLEIVKKVEDYIKEEDTSSRITYELHNSKLSKNEIIVNDNLFMLSLLVLLKPFVVRRADILRSKYSTNFKKSKEDKKNNYIYKEGKKYIYIANNYKTDKKYGQQIIKIENPLLIKILNRRFENNQDVLGGSDASRRKRLGLITKQVLGVKLNIQNLRHLSSSYLLENFNKLNISKEELQKLSNESGHDLLTKINEYWRN